MVSHCQSTISDNTKVAYRADSWCQYLQIVDSESVYVVKPNQALAPSELANKNMAKSGSG